MFRVGISSAMGILTVKWQASWTRCYTRRAGEHQYCLSSRGRGQNHQKPSLLDPSVPVGTPMSNTTKRASAAK
jgi:hypothetical protein